MVFLKHRCDYCDLLFQNEVSPVTFLFILIKDDHIFPCWGPHIHSLVCPIFSSSFRVNLPKRVLRLAHGAHAGAAQARASRLGQFSGLF